jgi:hypothetical protein
MREVTKLVGHIGVDAGLCWIGDPCYIMGEDASDNPQTWDDFCKSLGNEHPTMKSFNYTAGHEGLGVCVSTGFGDGSYPVYATISDEGEWGKRIKSITVVFIEEDE